jgi:hypothetical protein
MGVVAGLGIGLAVAGVVYFKDRHADTDAPAVQTVKANKKKAHGNELADADPNDSGAVEAPANSYDFYSKLPKFEVVVPEKEKDVRPDIAGVPKPAAAPTCCRRVVQELRRRRPGPRPARPAGHRVQGAKGIRGQRHLAPHTHRPDLQTR